MKKITARDPENLKFFHFLSCFFFPVAFIIRALDAVNTFFYARNDLDALLIAVLLAYFTAATAFTLKKFKPLSILWMILADVFMVLSMFINVSASIKANAPVEDYSANMGILLARLVFTIYSVIYILKRKSLFAKDYEAKKAMEEASFDTESFSEKKTKVSEFILWPVLTVIAYMFLYDWSSTLASEIYYVFPPIQKLLDFPFPTEVPMETAYSAFVLAIYVCLTIVACYVLKKAEIFTLDELNLTKKNKRILPFIIATVAGIIIVLLIALFQMKVYGSAIKVTKLFPRVRYTIICGFFYYLFVGINEEFLFRGFLLNFFLKKKKVVLGVLVSTLAFDLMHFVTGAYDEFRAFVFLFFLGLFEAMLYLLTKNIWLCAGVHFGYDWAVTHLIEMRFIATKNSFSFLTKLQKWTITTSISVVFLFFTIILFVIYMKRRHSSPVNLE